MNSNGTRKRIVVAMSGGVDSSVTAALLKEQGHDVIGVTMKTYDFDDVGGNVANETSCCGLGAMNDARLVATKLGIPHYVVDFRDQFREHVINYFVDEYMQGRTPNPCIMCNREIKWGSLIQKAKALGADYLATGHYAQVRFDTERGRFIISEAVDKNKDQSYALWALPQEALSMTMFPLGSLTKPEVRSLAEQFGLRTANKEESYEICFVADNNYERFLKEQVPALEERVAGGHIVLGNDIVGTHRGFPFYTIGQRKGIGAFGRRVYVTEIDSRTNTVRIGPDEELLHRRLTAKDVNLISIDRLQVPRDITAKVRYKDDATPARVVPCSGETIELEFAGPKRAITPGQSVVMYEGSDVLGGGIITKAYE
jgi:tRNA-specific 2-thiouridylase